jgi:hypothetical protein
MTDNHTNGQYPEPDIDISDAEFAEDPDAEKADFNQLHDLATQAQSIGLIAGHGYHQGQYELIHQGQIILLPVKEAMAYLQKLMDNL